MKYILQLLLFALFIDANSVKAQAVLKPWKGKKCAVVLTYDDAIHQHLDHALPVLDSLGFKASFYITAFSDASKNRINDWRRAAIKGHELGNHTLYHPCDASSPGRSWVTTENDLSKYSLRRIVNEVQMTNVYLKALDGKSKRTFAFTCGDMKVGNIDFIDSLKNDFIAARAVRHEMHKIQDVDLYNMDCYMVNNHNFDQLKAWVDQAIATNSLLVILFHGVGGGNALDVSLSVHRQFLRYLKSKQKDIYIAPLIEVAEHVKAWQGGNK